MSNKMLFSCLLFSYPAISTYPSLIKAPDLARAEEIVDFTHFLTLQHAELSATVSSIPIGQAAKPSWKHFDGLQAHSYVLQHLSTVYRTKSS